MAERAFKLAPAESDPDSLKKLALQEATSPATRSYILKVLRSRGIAPDSAEDLTQGIMMRTVKVIEEGRFEYEGSLRPWLNTLITNASSSLHRSRARQRLADETDISTLPDPEGENPEGKMARSQENERMLDLIGELPEGYQEVVIKRLAGRSYQEIADQLDIPIGTVMSRLHRAQKILQRKKAAAENPTEEGRASADN